MKMSVYRTDYVIIGIEVPLSVAEETERIKEAELLPFIEGHKDVEFSYIYDGMSGNYAIFGKVINTIDEHDEGGLFEIDKNMASVDREKLRISATKLFGTEVLDIPIKTYVLNHYH